jgi:5S rRNA maturation endonuclease (ribonuclease M5)
MRLHEVVVTNHRSVWGKPVRLRLAPAVTALVGPNLAGKSNLARAVALALDSSLPYDAAREEPRAAPGEVPEVVCTFHLRDHGRADNVTVTVSWPRGQRVVDVRPAGARDDLPLGECRVVTAWAGDAPSDVLARALPLLAEEDTAAVAADMLPTLRRVLPEISSLEIDAAGPTVTIRDDQGYEVSPTSIRATFCAALAAHFVRRGVELAAIVVEEPEVFLHPAAQESLRDEFLEVGVAADAPVLLTTESPWMVPRTSESKLIAVARDEHGRTHVIGGAQGDAPHATLTGGLFRDPGLAAVLDRTQTIPDDTSAVLIVEGGTDEAYLRLAARVLGRENVFDRVVIHSAGGALPAALYSIVLRAETDVGVFVLLDNDENGRRAKSTLVERFQFANRKQVTTYAEVIPDHPTGAEAEDVFDWRLVERFVTEHGDQMIRGKRILRADQWHFDLTSAAKSAFVGWLEEYATVADMGHWGAVLDLLDQRLNGGGEAGQVAG